MKTIILTGGGTAGHINPNIALIPRLITEGYKVVYIGDEKGMERELIESEGIPFYGIQTGKLRRQLNLNNIKLNLKDSLRVIAGVSEARRIIKKIRPDIIFSKGGFVSVPVVLGGRLNKVPIIIHESDFTPGLANKISLPFCDRVCTAFPETAEAIGEKALYTGTPIREELFLGSKEVGRRICGFKDSKPIILVMGGSQGSVRINKCVRDSVTRLKDKYNIIHLCGKGNIDTNYDYFKEYFQKDYAKDELKDLLAVSDIVVSRAGANAINEFLALKKPSLLIPLPARDSRGDQILNAESFKKQGFSMVLNETGMEPDSLTRAIDSLYEKRSDYINAMGNSKMSDGVSEVMEIIRKYR